MKIIQKSKIMLLLSVVIFILTGCSISISDGYDIGSDEPATTDEMISDADSSQETDYDSEDVDYCFRNAERLDEHYEKHGIEMGYDSAEDYESAANAVIHNPEALHKIEAEDGDDIYYVEETNDLVIVSTDGYIRTYFRPDRGIEYYNKQ